MQRQSRFHRSCVGAAYGLLLAAVPVYAVAAAEGPAGRPVTMRGTIAAVDGDASPSPHGAARPRWGCSPTPPSWATCRANAA
jgi:hypothetical protein